MINEESKEKFYWVVTNDNELDLIAAVDEMIEEGWIPSGGVAVSTSVEQQRVDRDLTLDVNVTQYSQAMVRTKEKLTTEFVVVQEHDPDRFVKEVNSMIQAGWRMHGESTILPTGLQKDIGFGLKEGNELIYLQPMVK